MHFFSSPHLVTIFFKHTHRNPMQTFGCCVSLIFCFLEYCPGLFVYSNTPCLQQVVSKHFISTTHLCDPCPKFKRFYLCLGYLPIQFQSMQRNNKSMFVRVLHAATLWYLSEDPLMEMLFLGKAVPMETVDVLLKSMLKPRSGLRGHYLASHSFG